jgi:hypothetical protein
MASGFNRQDRKYLVFVDYILFGETCGRASFYSDDRPGQNNQANGGTPGFAVLWQNCWLPTSVMHEVGHVLGAVQKSAPHSDGNAHCSDSDDLMCHTGDGFDPDGDDYYNPNPVPGSYLATHWNVASSRFLDVVEPQKVYSVFLPVNYAQRGGPG